MTLDREKIKKLLRGESAGNIATLICAAAAVYFAAAYSAGAALQIAALKTAALISGPAVLIPGAAAAALCNLKYGGALEKIVKDYVRFVLLENAALLRPGSSSLTFFISVGDDCAEIRVNNYKEKIYFDFSAFKKLSAARKAHVSSEICGMLTTTFVRLTAERGATYKSVTCVPRADSKNGKPVVIVRDGKPDGRAYKYYLKNG